MKILTPNEEHTLELLKKENFRSVTKDNVTDVVSIFEKLNPEVAKALIEQMPEAIKGIVEIERFYTDLLTKGIESCSSTADSCFNTEDKLVDAYATELNKDIPFEQKQYFVEHMESAAMRKEKKDTEHRDTLDKIHKYAGIALTLGVVVVLTLFLGGRGGGSPSNYRY